MASPLPSNGPGKYDDLCTGVRLAVNADAVILIVLGGVQGSGFSLQILEKFKGSLDADNLARLLRGIAEQIEKGPDNESKGFPC